MRMVCARLPHKIAKRTVWPKLLNVDMFEHGVLLKGPVHIVSTNPVYIEGALTFWSMYSHLRRQPNDEYK